MIAIGGGLDVGARGDRHARGGVGTSDATVGDRARVRGVELRRERTEQSAAARVIDQMPYGTKLLFASHSRLGPRTDARRTSAGESGRARSRRGIRSAAETLGVTRKAETGRGVERCAESSGEREAQRRRTRTQAGSRRNSISTCRSCPRILTAAPTRMGLSSLTTAGENGNVGGGRPVKRRNAARLRNARSPRTAGGASTAIDEAEPRSRAIDTADAGLAPLQVAFTRVVPATIETYSRAGDE